MIVNHWVLLANKTKVNITIARTVQIAYNRDWLIAYF